MKHSEAPFNSHHLLNYGGYAHGEGGSENTMLREEDLEKPHEQSHKQQYLHRESRALLCQ